MEFLKQQYGYPSDEILPAQITHEQLRAATNWQLQEFSTRSVANANLVSEELARRHRYVGITVACSRDITRPCFCKGREGRVESLLIVTTLAELPLLGTVRARIKWSRRLMRI
jgi:hypothetical protein